MFSNYCVSVILRTIFVFAGILNYVIYVFVIWGPQILEKEILASILIIIFTFLFIMLCWTSVVTSISDPGQVPMYWGFYMGDNDAKRSRYCLMCNLFKPERCHHCSVCNRCVLNMDHHCPWINNCIGFYNKKYFFQMLCYLILSLLLITFSNFNYTYTTFQKLLKLNFINNLSTAIGYISLIVIYLGDFIMTILLFKFWLFHFTLILNNKTTIENMEQTEKKHKNELKQNFDDDNNKVDYDLGTYENFIQVMGISKLLWFFPVKSNYGKPKGNGLDWGRSDSDYNDNINGTNYEKEMQDKIPESSIDNSNIDLNKSNLNKNNPGHSSMSSLYGKSGNI